MSRTIKFSEFSLPTNGTSDLYLVGYVEGEENTNVKISANDLSFSASGSAGVASVNGKNGLIQIQGDKGVTITEHDNVLTISGQNITIDQTFDETSQNPQSGAAISSQLENVAKTDAVATFKNDLIVLGDTDCKWIYGQGLTVNGNSTFNGNVIVEGRNISNTLGAIDSHIADYFIHVTPTDKEYWNNKSAAIDKHTTDTTIHISANDKTRWDNKADIETLNAHTEDKGVHVTAEEKDTWNQKLSESDLYTQTELTHRSSEGTTDMCIRWAQLSLAHGPVLEGKLTQITLPCRKGNASEMSLNPHYLGVWYENADGNWSKLAASTNPVIQTVNEDSIWYFEEIEMKKGAKYRLILLNSRSDDWGNYGVMGCRGIGNDNDGCYITNTSGATQPYMIDAIFHVQYKQPQYASFHHTKDNILHLSQSEHDALTQLLNNKDALLSLLTNNA